MRTGQKQFFLAFVRKEKVAEDTYFFYFDLAERGFVFLPGQYIDMVLPHKDPDNRGIERSFTIASSPLDKKYLMVTTKTIKSSFKKALENLKSSQPVEFNGPWGGFVLKEEETFPRVFLAGGIGITPFHSMISYANTKKLLIPISLIVSFSRIEDLVFRSETFPRVFLAGGIGITPFHSMISYANTKKLLIPISLIVSFSRIEDLVF